MQIRRPLIRVLGIAATAIALVAGLTSPANAAWESLVQNHIRPDPYDAGGRDAKLRYIDFSGSERKDMAAYFQAWGEELDVYPNRLGTAPTHIQVKVYRPAGNGTLHLVDTDNFTMAPGQGRVLNLGTPDGSGDIPEGYIVGYRLRLHNEAWSDWAYGTA